MTDTATANGKADHAAEYLTRTQRLDALREKDWRLELPGGQWAQLRDPDSITEGMRDGFKAAGMAVELIGQRIDAAMESGSATSAAQLVEHQAAAILRSDRVAILMAVQSWSFDIPPSIEAFNAIPGHAFDQLSLVARDIAAEAFVDVSVSREAASPFDASAS